jgi:hypothetical protein
LIMIAPADMDGRSNNVIAAGLRLPTLASSATAPSPENARPSADVEYSFN